MKNSLLVLRLAYSVGFIFLGTAELVAEGLDDFADSSAEIWVDGPQIVTPGNVPNFSDVAMDGQGRSIYVWRALTANGNDVFTRRFNRFGAPLDNPQLVNTLVADDQSNPRVAVSSDNTYLVIWQSNEPDPEDEDRERRWVRSQLFDASGAKQGSEQLISNLSTGRVVDAHADVAALTGGGYMVVWASANASGPDTNANIQGRLLSAAGIPMATQFQVNSRTGESEFEPAVAALDGGGYLAVWEAGDIYGREFSSSGEGLGNDFLITTSSAGAENNPDVIQSNDNTVLVVWEDADEAGNDFEIRGRMLNSALAGIGDDFRINQLIEDAQRNVRVGHLAGVGYLVAWMSDVTSGSDDDRSIQARIVTGANQFEGNQFQVNQWTTDAQDDPAVGGRAGFLSVSWSSGSNSETQSNVILARTWSICGIFCDSFE